MEGMTYLEHLGPGVSLDSWPMEGVSCLRQLEQSVLKLLIAARPVEDVDWKVLNLKPVINPVTDVKLEYTDASDDMNTDPPESLTPMSTPLTAFEWPCVSLPLLPMSKPDVVNQMKDSCEVNTNLPESSTPTIDSNLSIENWEDGVCRLLIYATEVSHDLLKTDSSDLEVVNKRNTTDEIYTDWTATLIERWLDTDDDSDTDSVAELEYKTWDDACAWEFRNTRGYTNMSLIQSPPTEMIRDYVSDVNSDTGSDAELDYKAREDASRAWRCHSAPADIPRADIPPGLVQNPTTDITRSNMKNDDYPEKFGRED